MSNSVPIKSFCTVAAFCLLVGLMNSMAQVPIFKDINEWISEVQSAKPGLDLLVKGEVGGVYFAIFQETDSELVVSTYDQQTAGQGSRVSFELLSMNGSALADVKAMKTVNDEDLYKAYQIPMDGGVVTSRVSLGMHYPITPHYKGSAFATFTVKEAPDVFSKKKVTFTIQAGPK